MKTGHLCRLGIIAPETTFFTAVYRSICTDIDLRFRLRLIRQEKTILSVLITPDIIIDSVGNNTYFLLPVSAEIKFSLHTQQPLHGFHGILIFFFP